MVLKVLLKFPLTLVLVHGWLFPEKQGKPRQKARVFLFAEPLKSLEKEGRSHKKKTRESRKRKKQGLEGQGDPPFPCFFRFPISFAFCVFCPSFPRISGVPRREKPCFCRSGFPPKKQGLEGRGGVIAEHFPQISAKFPQTFHRISAPFPEVRCQMMEAFLCPVRTGNNGF